MTDTAPDQSAEFAPFNPDAKCPKCGHDDVHTAWHKDGHEWGCRERHRRSSPECCSFEHIDRRCKRCSFEWVEMPLDGAVITPCPHMRPSWQMCPWCLGVNGDQSGKRSQEGSSPTAG